MDLLNVAQTLGVSVACLVALAWAVYKIGNKLIDIIGVPLLKAHTKFLETIEDNVGKHSQTLQKVMEIIENLGKNIDANSVILTQTKAVAEAMAASTKDTRATAEALASSTKTIAADLATHTEATAKTLAERMKAFEEMRLEICKFKPRSGK